MAAESAYGADEARSLEDDVFCGASRCVAALEAMAAASIVLALKSALFAPSRPGSCSGGPLWPAGIDEPRPGYWEKAGRLRAALILAGGG
jgi:hypothetical protein